MFPGLQSDFSRNFVLSSYNGQAFYRHLPFYSVHFNCNVIRLGFDNRTEIVLFRPWLISRILVIFISHCKQFVDDYHVSGRNPGLSRDFCITIQFRSGLGFLRGGLSCPFQWVDLCLDDHTMYRGALSSVFISNVGETIIATPGGHLVRYKKVGVDFADLNLFAHTRTHGID